VSDLRQIERGFAMLQYGVHDGVGSQAPNAERAALPSGEGRPPLDYWLDLLDRCATLEELRAVSERARAELERGAAGPSRRRRARPSRI
jgi:hypothetical protein